MHGLNQCLFYNLNTLKMTEIEEKSLKTQLELYRGVVSDYSQICATVNSVASVVINDLMEIKEKREDKSSPNVVLTPEQYKKLMDRLNSLSSRENFKHMNNWIQEMHIAPMDEKFKILNMLR